MMQQTVGKNSAIKTRTKSSDIGAIKLDREIFTRQLEVFLTEYCAKQIKDAHKVGPGYVQLWQEIDVYIKGGGKRIRPYITALSYAGYGGDDISSIIQIAASVEIFHTFLLVHDDIIDKDITRHGQLNITGSYLNKYKDLSPKHARHYADSAALLAGDLLLSASYSLVNNADNQASIKSKILAHYQKAMFLTGGGELIDIESTIIPIIESDPTSIMLHKTAIYSFALPLICGAELAHVPQDEIDKIEAVGLELGLIFQETDDFLGVFGDQGQTGKSNRTDIKEKKRTNLIKTAYQSSSSEVQKRLDELYSFNHTLTENEVDEVFHIVQDSGAKETIEKEIETKSKKLAKQISELGINEAGRQGLLGILKKISKRDN
jgi:geranylgeranyl pyrophosphate synthase